MKEKDKQSGNVNWELVEKRGKLETIASSETLITLFSLSKIMEERRKLAEAILYDAYSDNQKEVMEVGISDFNNQIKSTLGL